jgi:site-specific recombinase XerD
MTEQLTAVNGRLVKGQGWVGYRNNGGYQSKFLYYAFYRGGKQVFVNTKSNDPEEAYKQLLEARSQTARGILVLASEATRFRYDDLRRTYIEDKPRRGEGKYRTQLKRLDSFFTGMKATSIDTAVIRKYINKRREHVEGPTIRRELSVLRSMFKLAAREKALSNDQVPYFPMPDDSLAAGTYITPEQFQRILIFLPDGSLRQSTKGGPKSTANLRPFFTFLYATACRLDAAMNLTWKSITDDLKFVEIPSSGTKNKQPLRLPLAGSFLAPVIKELKKGDANTPLFDSSNYRTEWAIACAKAGLGTYDEKNGVRTGVRIHDCRCSGAINLLAAGVDEGLVLKVGGWKTRSMLDRYNVADMTRLTEAMEKGGKFLTDRLAVAGAAR